ncbi:hypothetical protein ACSV4D_13350 [Flavobacterium sp. ARAG 55.4]|uniref:hypothetical protein n=1 Tax=Flavobacterium sp. ARAG 55.4 TaxID=3451357 RepID=UPI003F4835B6
MMKIIQNIAVGFIVSFLGSLPLGYLNIVGLEVYSKLGLEPLVFYILGVICIEAFVAYYTLIFAHQLVQNKKLMKGIEVFGVFFLLVVAFIFHQKSSHTVHGEGYLDAYLQWPVFAVGVFLSCFNFLQIPFWLAWNLYFLNGNYISIYKRLKFYYVGGTMVGVFFGMLFIIYFLDKIHKQIAFLTDYMIPVIIPVFFVCMSGLQGYKVYKKYFYNKMALEEKESE